MRPWMTLFVLPVSACALIGEPGSGISATEMLDLETFDSIRLASQIDLELTEGEAIAGTFTCDDNLLDNPRFEVRGSTLVIDTPPGQQMRPRVDCFAEITVVGLVEVQNAGSGAIDADVLEELAFVRSNGSGAIDIAGTDALSLDVDHRGSGAVRIFGASVATDVTVRHGASGQLTVDDLVADFVAISQSGSGSVTLDGTTEMLDVTHQGSGRVDASSLEATDVDVALRGSGATWVFATGSVSGTLSGSGGLVVDGPARVDVRDTGSGRVR